MANCCFSAYLPQQIGAHTGPTWSFTDRFSPQATEWPCSSTWASSGPESHGVTVAMAGAIDADPPPHLWLRNSPITRASRVNVTFPTSGLTGVTLNSCSRSNVTDAADTLHGHGPATATPVMVTTSTSGLGCCTRM